MSSLRLTPTRAAVLTGVYVASWCGLVLAFPEQKLLESLGWGGLYLIGLIWSVYGIEWAAQLLERRKVRLDPAVRPQIAVAGDVPDPRGGGWNPLDPAAWYFDRSPSYICLLLALVVMGIGGLQVALGAWHVHTDVPPEVSEGVETEEPPGPGMMHNGLMQIAIGGVIAVLPVMFVMTNSRRLRQSLAMFAAYSLLFFAVYFLAHLQFASAGDEIESDLPAGGGNDSIKPTQVKVQKVVRKKYIVNPYSSILFAAPPPIDQVKVDLNAETANQYKAGSGPGGLGQGSGKGGGFGSGTGSGKIELIRLQHSDKAWNKNFGIGGDRNLVAKYKEYEPLATIGNEDKSIDYSMLARASAKKPFPLIYIGGAHTFAPTENERKILREYLIDKHGMILGDNLGGAGFHNNFISEMNRITGVTAVPIPRDDRIHQRPFDLPQLPIVVAHGGTTALGWKIDGRWAVYYHPGALSDAWRDDHAGIKKAVWQSCEQLGINILFYAYAEQDKWRQAQQVSP